MSRKNLDNIKRFCLFSLLGVAYTFLGVAYTFLGVALDFANADGTGVSSFGIF